jgi:ceramide glucosyltransferase
MLDDPKVGATTAIYRTIEDVDLPEIIEAIHIETNFIPSVLVASKLGPIKYAFGASIAIRMDVLKRIGGFASIKDYLADDYMLAKKIIKAGNKIKLAPYIVSIIPSTKTVKDAIIHVLRWYRTIKVCNPIGYFFSVICYPTFWAILNSIYLHGSFTSAFMLLLAIFFRMASSISVLLLLDTDIYRSFTNPLSDIISVFIWIWSFLGNKVQWRGKTYKVFFDGRVIQLE